MSQKNPIRVFVTHNWHDQDDYSRVFEYLESMGNFFYRNTSTPEKPPQASDSEGVREDLRRQIGASEVVIALASLHAEQPDLTIFQMNYAKSQKKPVVLLKQFGLKSEPSKLLVERADDVVEWEKRALVDAIRRLARGENTARFDTIDFNPDEFKDFKAD